MIWALTTYDNKRTLNFYTGFKNSNAGICICWFIHHWTRKDFISCVPITHIFHLMFHFFGAMFSLISSTVSHTSSSMKWLSQMYRCVSLGCFENVRLKLFRQHTGLKKKEEVGGLCSSHQKKIRKREDSSFLTYFFTLSDSISRSIGISEVTRHEISPILGFQRNCILKTPEICGHITSSSFGQTALLCDSCKSKTVMVAVRFFG